MKELYRENLWNKIHEEINSLKKDESMQKFFNKNILNFSNLTDSITYLISNKLTNDDIPEGNIIDNVREAFLDNGILIAIEEDINEVFKKDPACNYYFQPLLFYKGFHSITAYRVANYWLNEKPSFSMYIQSIVSEKFNVDIHPNAKIGKGIMVDHASGVVIGETAQIGDYSSLFHGVTLGGVGSEKGQRHPKIGKNVMLSANSTLVGNF